MSAADLQSFGWRIPFAFGLLIGPVGYYVRSRMSETPEFLDAGAARAPLRELVVEQWDRLLLTIGAVVASTSSQYMLVLHADLRHPRIAPAAIDRLHRGGGWLPRCRLWSCPLSASGSIASGKSRIMMGAALLFFLTSYPAFVLLDANASLAVLIAMVCWLGLLKSFFSGALPSLMAKIFPISTRVTGMSLSYNIAVPIFGGFAPFFAQSLIDITGSKLAPSYYMMATALLSLAALIALRRRYRL